MDLISIDLSALVAPQKQFAAMRERMGDLRPAWDVVHRAFLTEESEQFATQGAHLLDEQWAPLSPAYAKRKKAKLMKLYGSPTPPAPYGILYLTGDFFRSMTQKDADGHVFVPLSDNVIMGSSVSYGQFHQADRKVIKPSDSLRGIAARSVLAWVTWGTRSGRVDPGVMSLFADLPGIRSA